MSEQMPQSAVLNLTPAIMAQFEPIQILSESTLSGSTFILGKLHEQPAIIHIQKTAVIGEKAKEIIKNLQEVETILENQPYYSAHAWARPDSSHPDLVLKLICPASSDHIKKYSVQERLTVCETAQIYQDVVRPYIESLPVSKIQWVYEILEGKKEADRVYHCTIGDEGFVILPDLKWDEVNENSLYFVAIVNDRGIRSLRDLTRQHIPLLQDIRKQAAKVAKDRFLVEEGKLRMFVHYQPTYYHFHVHIVHIKHDQLASQIVGQAHLLEDIISLLELSPENGSSLLACKSFTYTLGVEHSLYTRMLEAGAVLGYSTTILTSIQPIPVLTTLSSCPPLPVYDIEDEPPAKQIRLDVEEIKAITTNSP
ncbi:hypothetical protein L204_101926 [Cryptococcus depauperatus]|nr:scavenger mRNA-decapping enzyme DcpS [Cryptococcus depauperatus CBS 7855]